MTRGDGEEVTPDAPRAYDTLGDVQALLRPGDVLEVFTHCGEWAAKVTFRKLEHEAFRRITLQIEPTIEGAMVAACREVERIRRDVGDV